MPKSALTYALGVVVAGAAVLLMAAVNWHCQDPVMFVTCLGLAAVGCAFKVRLPGLRSTIAPGFIFVLVGITKLSWMETAAISAVCGAVQCLWQARRTPNPVQVAFNVATLTLCGVLAHRISQPMGSAGASGIVALATSSLVLVATNSLVVSVVLCLTEGRPFRSLWQSCHFWAFPYYMAGAVIASIWIHLDLKANACLYLCAAASLYMLSSFYEEAVRRLPVRSGCPGR